MMTPFEETGEWTSIADAENFCEALKVSTSRVTIQQWGPHSGAQSRLGMFSTTVGTGPVSCAVVASIHGNERSGREAAMAFARDLAETSDPALIEYLSENSWSIMVQANPAGFERNIRNNANGVDINRTYHLLSQPESYAIDTWLQWASPALIIDCHEMGGSGVATGQISADSDAGLVALAGPLDAAIVEALTAIPRSWTNYGPAKATTLRGEAPARWKAVAQLVEIGTTIRIADRVSAQSVALNTALEHHVANAAAFSAAHSAAGGSPPGVPVLRRRRGGAVATLM